MDAIKLIEKDHKEVKKLLRKLENAQSTAARESNLAHLGEEIKTHARIEEEFFYPAYADIVQKTGRSLYFEAAEEHHIIDLVLSELQDTVASSERFSAKSVVLRELIEHHMKEEEEMLAKARSVLSKEDLMLLGERMMQRREQLTRGPEVDFARTPAYAARRWRW